MTFPLVGKISGLHMLDDLVETTCSLQLVRTHICVWECLCAVILPVMTALELWRPGAVSRASRSSHDFPHEGVTNSTKLCPFPSHGAKARICPGLPTATDTERKQLKENIPQLLLYNITEQICVARRFLLYFIVFYSLYFIYLFTY